MGVCAQFIFDFQQAVVFGGAFGAAGRPGLNQAAVQCGRQIGNRGVFGLAAAVADDGFPTDFLRHADGGNGLGEGADLIQFNENGVGCFGFNAPDSSG